MTGLEPAILFLAVGLGVVLAGRAPLERFHGAALPGLAWLAGLLALTWAVMIPALATERFFMPVVWLAGAAGVGITAWRFMDVKRRAGSVNFRWPEGALGRFVFAVLALGIVYNVWLITSLALSYPIIGYDAIGNYAMKAQLWLHTRELFPVLLLDPEFVMYHRRYPPAVPVAEMTWSFVLGGWDDVKLKWFFLLSWLGLCGAMYALLRRKNEGLIALAGVALWVALPYHLRELHGGVTDAYPEALLQLALVAGMLVARELGRERAWAPAALMAFILAGGVLIKQEGLIFIGLAAIYLLAIRAPLKNAALLIAFTGVNVAIWKLAGRGVPDFMDESYAQLNVSAGDVIERLKFLVEFAAEQITHKDQWGLVVWALPAVWVYKLWRVPAKRWLSLELGAALVLMFIYTLVLLNTPLDFEVHLDTTLHRLFIQVLPFLMIASFDGLGEGRPLMESRLLRWMRRHADSPTPPETPADSHDE